MEQFTPGPAYVQGAYAEELRLARDRVVYLSACLRQVQAEAQAQISELTQRIQQLTFDQEDSKGAQS